MTSKRIFLLIAPTSAF